ncbi:MAG: SLC13 family permease [bacterium]
MPKILLVDDEDKFRISMSERLKLRGYDNVALARGEDALKAVRKDLEIDVVVLDRKMPGMSGEQVLKELKHFRPELQIIMLTGFGSMDSAVESGRLDAYSYLEKPCEIDELIQVIENARRDKPLAMEKHEIPQIERGSLKKWLIGSHNFRPGFIILGVILFFTLVLMPPPQSLLNLLSTQKKPMITDSETGKKVFDPSDVILGYASYSKMKDDESIADYYSKSCKLEKSAVNEAGQKVKRNLTPEEAAFRAKVMLGTLLIGALFWATGALPIGITALLIGVFMYFLGVMRPDDIAQAYAKDAVIFIFGVLVVAHAISKTGLDRRIGLLLLWPSTSLWKFLFIFLPMVGIACSFLSEHALVAFLMPILIIVYATATREAGVDEDRALAVMMILSLCYAANCGGPGSPAAGGRNAVMVGILADYGMAPSFGQWVKYGLPFVPVTCFLIGLYFFIVFRGRIKARQINFSAITKQAASRIGPMNHREVITAIAMVLLVTLWVTSSETYGMGGPVILIIVLLTIFRVINWTDVTKIQWEVVALYASACAMGKGLASSGAALYLAQSFINVLPDFMRSGEGLAIACSIFTGLATNLMSDGATVSAIGPITIPMAMIANTHPWMVAFATAFASSFAHTLIIGTPNNAIAYTMAKDPRTGKQLITLGDFIKHGLAVLLISWLVLWVWIFFIYWRWIGFK